ncbi:SNF2-related protein [Nitzschia inconspicua]|uniref:SNF2-related protein n=1 Tax=Nitzschia inconspicua TaxID=303405 RepID=A0A9K3M602_9STRA|nr:SNF2-related protein [Nitzschia inconspicua]
MSIPESKMENQPQPPPDGETATTSNAVNPATAAVPSETTVKVDVEVEGDTIVIKEEVEMAVETSATSVMNGDVKPVDSNGSAAAASTAAAVKTETQASNTEAAATGGVEEEEEEDDAQSVKSEGADEEDALFTNLEQEEEKEEASHPHEQPKDATAAPKLLQSALVKGDVKMDDSEHGAVEDTVKNSSEEAGEEEHHIHQRQSQLDFLLSKAAEYSSFISRDLEELQSAMTETARMKAEKAEKRAKKRKGSDAKGGSSKKKTKGSSGEALKSALVKDAQVRTGSKPIFIQPPNLSEGCFLKDYQLEGVRWLASLYENGVSGILADEMGLGKTIQVIALVAHLLTQNVTGAFLVVAPLATLPNWEREFEKWLPSKPAVRYHGTAADREELMKGPLNPKLKRDKDFPVVITSFETAIRDQKKLAKLAPYTYVIVDEGHRLKNHRCMLIQSLKQLPAINRLLLTGTPIQNTLNELWSLLNFVNPQIFDDLSVFQSWFGFKDIGQKTHGGTTEEDILLEQRKNQTVSKLHNILRPFLLRRVKVDVLSEMPPKKEVVVYSGMSKLQQGYATLIEKGVLRDELIRQGIEDGRTLSQTNKMMNQRKNVNHPFIFGEPLDPSTGNHIGTQYPQLLVRASGKFALMDRMLERLHRDGHQVLIFSQMTKVLNIIEDYLQYRNWKYCRIDGQTHIDDRQKAMDVFNSEKTGGANGTRNLSDDRYFVFMLSTRAGGLGINLTAADTCIIFDSDWNPHADSQAMDRCHRLGQTRPVAVYRLLTCNSVDIEMMEKQVSKKKLERMTIAAGDFRKAGMRSMGEMSVEKLQGLLKSDIQDLEGKQEVEDIKIDDEEFDMIMDRKRLFAEGDDAIPQDGKMYNIINAASGDVLGAMTT